MAKIKIDPTILAQLKGESEKIYVATPAFSALKEAGVVWDEKLPKFVFIDVPSWGGASNRFVYVRWLGAKKVLYPARYDQHVEPLNEAIRRAALTADIIRWMLLPAKQVSWGSWNTTPESLKIVAEKFPDYIKACLGWCDAAVRLLRLPCKHGALTLKAHIRNYHASRAELIDLIPFADFSEKAKGPLPYDPVAAGVVPEKFANMDPVATNTVASLLTLSAVLELVRHFERLVTAFCESRSSAEESLVEAERAFQKAGKRLSSAGALVEAQVQHNARLWANLQETVQTLSNSVNALIAFTRTSEEARLDGAVEQRLRQIAKRLEQLPRDPQGRILLPMVLAALHNRDFVPEPAAQPGVVEAVEAAFSPGEPAVESVNNPERFSSEDPPGAF